MKRLVIIISAMLLAFAACSDSDSNNTNQPDSGQNADMDTTAGDLGEDVGDSVADMSATTDASSGEPDASDMRAADEGGADVGLPDDVVAEALAAVNAVRAEEQMCGNEVMGPVGELTAVAELTEAAQGHADDMAAMEQITFTGSDGSNSRERVEATGWSGMFLNESIASGQTTAVGVVEQLISSEGTCQNLMAAAADSLGAGAAEADSGPSPYWSIVLGQQ